ncbi:hypothetical protein X777_03427 [Ooceraea biroi]|uniref:Uncharacterized protein n=1 Tax=Ooceraea biroi TaxID=2015173 RepID=A0A026X273_OOCBI|nr:hypothetical protein X777_03427 [Ooceraea biroi]
MNIGDHRAHVSGTVSFSTGRIFLRVYVFLDRRVPRALVTLVNAYKFPDSRVVRESVHAAADREHYHGRRAVESVSGRDQVPSWLQRGLDRGFLALFGLFVNSEDRADRNQAVDVGRAVERIEAHDVLATLLRFHLDRVLVLLAHEDARGERGCQHVDEELVAQDIKLLHFLALHVGIAGDPVPERT